MNRGGRDPLRLIDVGNAYLYRDGSDLSQHDGRGRVALALGATAAEAR